MPFIEQILQNIEEEEKAGWFDKVNVLNALDQDIKVAKNLAAINIECSKHKYYIDGGSLCQEHKESRKKTFHTSMVSFVNTLKHDFVDGLFNHAGLFFEKLPDSIDSLYREKCNRYIDTVIKKSEFSEFLIHIHASASILKFSGYKISYDDSGMFVTNQKVHQRDEDVLSGYVIDSLKAMKLDTANFYKNLLVSNLAILTENINCDELTNPIISENTVIGDLSL